jgi:hypothetical protein
LYGAFVWARWALNSQKRRFRARAGNATEQRIVLLGEAAKFISVSPQRVATLEVECGREASRLAGLDEGVLS